MTRLCLDTSAYSHFCRGHPAAVEQIDGARAVYVPAVALGELRAGFRAGRHEHENEERLRFFLADPVVSVVDLDDEASMLYAELWGELRRAGTPVPTNDVWIAAAAVQVGATVLTYDAHFTLMSRVGTRVLEA